MGGLMTSVEHVRLFRYRIGATERWFTVFAAK
jgi:hypothetical protein